MNKVKVGILGATGLVGQAFLWMLSKNKLFIPSFLVASEKRAGRSFKEEVRWLMPYSMPSDLAELEINKMDFNALEKEGCKIIFSALPKNIATEIEPELRKRGFLVFSNAGAMRREENVPILIPEVNPEAIELIYKQGYPENGFIITNANCSTTGLALALAPLVKYGIDEIYVTTYQSLSGAGYPGISSMDILGNLIPYIDGEEEKMIFETRKILKISSSIFPTCIRVPVMFGHLESVWIKFKERVKPKDIIEAWTQFEVGKNQTESQPSKSIVYCPEQDRPHPGMSFHGSPPGMTVYTGRARKYEDKIGFVLLVNNIIRGAAGGSIQNAELFYKKHGNQI
jgi:aspartate-semialdehyde dehydrogenase